MLTSEQIGGLVGRGKYLVWPVYQNLLDVSKDVDRGIG